MIKRIERGYDFGYISTLGGTLTDFVHNGRAILYPQKSIEKGKKRGGLFFCFPFFGPSPEEFKDINQHGWLREQELNTYEQKERCSLILTGSSNPKKSFPWQMNYSIIYSMLANNCLKASFQVERIDNIEDPMPINLGIHPYFNSFGKKRNLVINDDKIGFHDEAKIIPFENWRRSLILDLGRETVKMQLGGDFTKKTHLCLWTDNDQYFCLEPIQTHPDHFNTLQGEFLGKGEKAEFEMYLEVI